MGLIWIFKKNLNSRIGETFGITAESRQYQPSYNTTARTNQKIFKCLQQNLNNCWLGLLLNFAVYISKQFPC